MGGSILEHGLCVKDTLFPEKILGAENQPNSVELISTVGRAGLPDID